MFILTEHHKDSIRISLIIESRNEHSEGNLYNIAAFGHSFWFTGPNLIKPKYRWVDLSRYEWATPHADGSKGYTEKITKRYGFTVTEGALHLYYGIQPGSWSATDKENSDHSKCYFLPWSETRRVRYDFLKPDGSLFGSVADYPDGRIDCDGIEETRKLVPKSVFVFRDYDGEEITATCHQTVMRWEYGTGLFKFMKFFKKPIIRHQLEIEFDKETGYEKGSYKGGTCGTPIDMLPNETPLEAFIRYGTSQDYFKGFGQKNRVFSEIKQKV